MRARDVGGVLLGLLVGAVSCSGPLPDAYTALRRYNATDFRVAGIDARLVHGPDARGEAIVELRAVVLDGSGRAYSVEWLDCPSSQPFPGGGTSACLGTRHERRLGRGETLRYRYRPPTAPPREGDGGVPSADFGGGDEFDDGVVYVRARRGDDVRYGRKQFTGLFEDDGYAPRLVRLEIDGREVVPLDGGTARLRRGQRAVVRATFGDIYENHVVQWFS